MVNYISQLTAAMQKIADDNRLNPSHVSLYLALFQFWNLNRFENPISINRSDTMKVSKIGSKTTYHRCITELMKWEYLEYMPSKNPIKGSTVNMYTFRTTSGTSTEQAEVHNSPNNGQVVGQVLVPSINSINNTNNNKQRKGESHSPISVNPSSSSLSSRKPQKRFPPPSLNEIIEFFKEKKANTEEAEKFFNHFESNGWKVGGKTPMKNWQAAAKNWILRSKNFAGQNNQPKPDRLNVNQNKDYGEPL